MYSSVGLPIGLQIIAKPWQDHKILAFAKKVQAVLGIPRIVNIKKCVRVMSLEKMDTQLNRPSFLEKLGQGLLAFALDILKILTFGFLAWVAFFALFWIIFSGQLITAYFSNINYALVDIPRLAQQFDSSGSFILMLSFPIASWYILKLTAWLFKKLKYRRALYLLFVSDLPEVGEQAQGLGKAILNLSTTIPVRKVNLSLLWKSFKSFFLISGLVVFLTGAALFFQSQIKALIPLYDIVNEGWGHVFNILGSFFFGIYIAILFGLLLVITNKFKFRESRFIEKFVAVFFRSINIYMIGLFFTIVGLQFFLNKNTFICHIPIGLLSGLSTDFLIYFDIALGYCFVIIPALKIIGIKSEWKLQIFGLLLFTVFAATFKYVCPRLNELNVVDKVALHAALKEPYRCPGLISFGIRDFAEEAFGLEPPGNLGTRNFIAEEFGLQ